VYDRIGEEIANRFHIGYAPTRGLISRLEERGVSPQEARIAGLTHLDDNGSFYEVFSNRIIFPIVHANMVVGFGGRAVSENAKSKYVNSRASPLYNKSEVLYGLWYTRQWIDKLDYVILVEGYFDVLSLFSGGVKNCVATCGTALSKKHVKMLRRYTGDCRILFDGDKAGKEASKRAKAILIQGGMAARIIKLPSGFDPDEYLKEKGKDKLLGLVDNI
jgi:DNA primase